MSTVDQVDKVKEQEPSASAPPASPTESQGQDRRARQQAALLTFGRQSSTSPGLAQLMQDAANLVGEMLDADLSGVGEVVSDGNEVQLRVTSLREENASAEPLQHKSAMKPDDSLAAYALQQAAPIVSPDLAQEKRFKDLFLRKQGVSRALVVPLHLPQEPYGVLAVYGLQARPIPADDVQFAETIALMLSSSIARIRAEEQFRQERTYASAVLSMIDALILVLNPQGQVMQVNPFAEQLSGFSFSEVQGKPLSSVFFQPHDGERFRQCLRSCVQEKNATSMECKLLAKDGQTRRILWSMQALASDEAPAHAVVLAGVDRTKELEKAEQIEQLRLAAAEAARMVRSGELVGEDIGRLRRLLAKAPLSNLEGEEFAEEPLPFEPVSPHVPNDKRRSPRRAFRYRQMIAPLYGDSRPSLEQFFEVPCEDISAGGFSFYLDRPPDFDQLVVVLGRAPALSYYTAQVVRSASKKVQGKEMILIGCQFNGRV